MANPKKHESITADESGNALLSTQQANVADLTDSSGGTADGTIAAISGSGADADINNNFAECATHINSILAMLEAHGLMSDS